MSSPVSLVTGGEGDLAQGISAELRTLGYEVLQPSRRDLDVRSAESVDAYFEGLDRLDLLVNNAGVTRDSLFARLSEENWDEVIDTNLKGAFLCTSAALGLMMRQRNGHIIQIGSFSAISPPLGQANYAAAKAGLIGLTKSIAKEWGKRNIRCNCVLPGFLETKMTAGLSEEAVAAAKDRHALGRFNTVEEASRFIAFLAGTENISGQIFQLDSRT